MLPLDELPPEMLARVVEALASAEDIAHIDCVSRAFHGDPSPPLRSVVLLASGTERQRHSWQAIALHVGDSRKVHCALSVEKRNRQYRPLRKQDFLENRDGAFSSLNRPK
jgi:hypothetical protein